MYDDDAALGVAKAAAPGELDTAIAAYESAIAAEGSAAVASELKKSLITLINTRLVPYLSTMKMVDETRYGHFADTAAQIIADTNGAILVRSNKPESATPEPVTAN